VPPPGGPTQSNVELAVAIVTAAKTNYYLAHHDAHSITLSTPAFVNQTQRSYRGCNGAAQSRGVRQSARYAVRLLRLPDPYQRTKIRLGSPVQWPESQLTANVEPPVAISRSVTLAFERSELLDAFAHKLPDTLALHRVRSAKRSRTIPVRRSRSASG